MDVTNKFEIGHTITIWLFIIGLLLSGLSRGNDIENQQIQTQARQQEIIRQQTRIEQDVRDAKIKQEKILEILTEIKAGQGNGK